jgi:hypothetical protein
MADAFGRMLLRKITGEYSCPCHVAQVVEKYMKILEEKCKAKRYMDIVYVEGYIDGLMYLLVKEKKLNRLPRYFVFGNSVELRSLAQYRNVCGKTKSLDKHAYDYAVKMAKRLGDGSVYHHTPFLQVIL